MSAPTTDGQTLELSETLGLIEVEATVWVRLAAQFVNNDWLVRVLEMTSGEEPATWQLIQWDYAEVHFWSDTVSGSEITTWLRSGQVTMDSTPLRLPDLAERSGWIWCASRQPFGLAPLAWPSWQVELGANHQLNEPRNPLVGSDDAPTFATFYDAASFFFAAGDGPPGGQIIPTIRYRHQDTSGRIEGINPGEDQLGVDLVGTALGGMVVELAGKTPGPTQRVPPDLNGQAHLSIPLPNGLPADAWIALRDGTRLVDRQTVQRRDREHPGPGAPLLTFEGATIQPAELGTSGQSARLRQSPGTLDRNVAGNLIPPRKVEQNEAAFDAFVSRWSRSGWGGG